MNNYEQINQNNTMFNRQLPKFHFFRYLLSITLGGCASAFDERYPGTWCAWPNDEKAWQYLQNSPTKAKYNSYILYCKNGKYIAEANKAVAILQEEDRRVTEEQKRISEEKQRLTRERELIAAEETQEARRKMLAGNYANTTKALRDKWMSNIIYKTPFSAESVRNYKISCANGFTDGRYVLLENLLLLRLAYWPYQSTANKYTIVDSRGEDVRVLDIHKNKDGRIVSEELVFTLNKWGELQSNTITGDVVALVCYGYYGAIVVIPSEH